MIAALVVIGALVGVSTWLKWADDRRTSWANATHEPLEGE